MLAGSKYLNLIFQSILIVFTLLCSSAHAENKQVLCPAFYLIKNKWEHLDTVQILDEKKFLVYSDIDSVFDEQSKLWWQIATIPIASDFNTAYAIGQNNVKNITRSQEQYANIVNDAYSCGYVDNTGTITVVAQAYVHSKSNQFKNIVNHL